MRRLSLVLVFACALAGSAVGALAQEDDRPVIAADASHTGYIDLLSFGAEGTQVTFRERVGRRSVALGTGRVGRHGSAVISRAASWKCHRLVRRFEATAVDPAGVRRHGRFSLRTPSCRHRVTVEVPRRVRPGQRFAVRLRDGWGLGGIRPKLCSAFAGRAPTCRALRLARRADAVERAMRLPRKGPWRVSARLGPYSDSHRIGVGVRAPREPVRPVVLSTGDSTIQGIENHLEDRLPPNVRIFRDYFPGTGISRPLAPWWPYWPALAQRLAQERVPRLTVISTGANDGHAMDTPEGGRVECCAEPWVAEYSRRVREVMAAFVRRDQGRVLWLTLPAPRRELRRQYAAAVNTAIRTAASGQRRVRLVELDRVLTPGFRFRERITFRGRTVRVREPDGIHLTAAGTDIAARAVASAIAQWSGSLR